MIIDHETYLCVLKVISERLRNVDTAVMHWVLVGLMSATFILAMKLLFVQWFRFGPITTLVGAI